MARPKERTEYGARVFEARTRAKLTQPQLAERAGMSQGTLGELEWHANSSRYTAQIAAACGVRAEWLATGEGEMIERSAMAPEVAEIAMELNALPPEERALVIRVMRAALPSKPKESSAEPVKLTQSDDRVSRRKDQPRTASR